MMNRHKILLGLDRATWGYSIKTICEELNNNNLDGLEIQPEHPELFEKFPKIKKNILDLIQSYNFKISIHAPIKDINISSYNPWIREKSIEILLSTIDFASEFDKIEYCLFHGGQNSFRSNSKFELKQRKVALKRTIDVFKMLIKKCEDIGITMGIENMTHSDFRMTSKIGYLQQIFSDPDLQNLKFIFDYEHGINYSARYSLRILRNFKDRLIAVHIGNDFEKFKDIIPNSNLFIIIEPHHFYDDDKVFENVVKVKNNLKKLFNR